MEVMLFGGPGGHAGPGGRGGPGGPHGGHWGPPPPRPPMGGRWFRRRPFGYGYGGCFPGGCGCFTMAILIALMALGGILFLI